MPHFAANLSLMFTEVPFLERFGRAAQAGFTAVEFLFPYAWRAREIRQRLDDHGLQLVLHNVYAGDWDGGERGLACDPRRRAEFRASVEQARDYALALGVAQLHALSGLAPPDVTPEVQRATWLDNMAHAATVFGASGLRLLIEPLNRFDVPGYYLQCTAQAIDLLDALGVGNAFLQYDLYHAQRSEGELAATLARLLPRIAHIQVADNPGRHEPGSGEVHYDFLFAEMDRLGYAGWVGCEYRPQAGTEAGLGWLARWRTA